VDPQTGVSSSPANARTTLIVLLILALATALSIYLQNRAPDVVPENAAVSEFSAARALQQLRVFSARPRPIGSQDHANARDYILRELSNLELLPETQRTVAVSTRWGSPFAAATVNNVLARIRGTNNARAVLLLAHYDSVASSYGASDDGAGVVTLLETARALKASGPLKNDVILLFTDAEEIGLLGASAFTTHPWAREVGVFLNFEARGNSGPVVMFETSTGNSDLIRQFDRAAPRPIGSSFFYEIYKLLPNDTDFTILNSTGAQGLNFAYLDGIQHYHTYLDSADAIDPGSLQHLGANALALAKHFGNTDVGPRSVDAVYFNFLGANLIQYSNAFAIALQVLTFFLFGFVVWKGIKTRQLTLIGIVWGFLALLVAVVVSALTTWLAWWLVMKVRPSIAAIPWSEPYDSNIFRIALVLLALGVTAAVYTLIRRRRTDWLNLTTASLLWWLILSVAATVMLPGGSYLFTLPLLFGLIGAGLVLYSRDSEKSRLILAITMLPAVILWAPMIYAVFVALTLNSASMVIVCVALLFGLLIAPIVWSISLWRWYVPGALVAASIVLIFVGILSSGFDKNEPKMNNLIYALDANAGRAFFASSDERPDEWTTQFLSSGVERANMREFFPGNSRPYWRSAVTAAQLAGPNASVTGDQTENDVRALTIRVTSPRSAPVISMYGIENEILDATVDGKRAFRVGNDRSQPGPPMRNWAVQFYALPAEGVEVTIKTKADKPFKLLVVDRSYGLPEISNANSKPRPDHMIATPYGLSDVTLVAKTFAF
jgi:hypothetical protein